jgi:hypothetical protein
MPRRRGPEANRVVTQTRTSRRRYFLRNPDVRKAINELLDTYDLLQEAILKRHTAPRVEVKAPRREGGELRELYGLGPISNEERRTAELKRKAGEIEERLTALAKLRGILFPSLRRGRLANLGEPLPKLAPDTVAQYEALLATDDLLVSVIYDQGGETWLSAQELGDPYTLYLAIDLAYPQDVLLAKIEQSLRQAISERSSIIKRATGQRQRSDKADFELAVFDQVTAMATFQQVAAGLGQPVSSVKSAYVAACRKIGITRPRKRQAPLVGFDPADHDFQTCRICKHAKRPEDFCGPARAYSEQDCGSQRERPFADPEKRPHRAVKPRPA